MAERVRDRLSAVLEAERAKDIVDVGFRRRFGDDQALGDLAIRATFADQPEHFGFPAAPARMPARTSSSS